MHAPKEIRSVLQRGADPNTSFGGKAPLDWLIEMYTRTAKFADCVSVMLDAGAQLQDTYLRAILLDDPELLRTALAETAADQGRNFSLECAYTSMHGVSGLHICAEYNAVECARALLDLGMHVDVRADVDDAGLGGQTAIFHCVNSNRNYCRPMLELLLEAGADLEIRLRGLVWGGGFEWETIQFDVSPISYAQCGLYPQFQRQEVQVYGNIDLLYRRRHGEAPPARNVPNKYVRPDFDLGAARGGQTPL